MWPMMRRNVQRFESPEVDLDRLAREVLAGRAQLGPEARRLMAEIVGTPPDHATDDRRVAMHYAAKRGLTR